MAWKWWQFSHQYGHTVKMASSLKKRHNTPISFNVVSRFFKKLSRQSLNLQTLPRSFVHISGCIPTLCVYRESKKRFRLKLSTSYHFFCRVGTNSPRFNPSINKRRSVGGYTLLLPWPHPKRLEKKLVVTLTLSVTKTDIYILQATST